MFDLALVIGEAPVRILGIGGSMRAESKTLVLLHQALRRAEAAGAGVFLGDVRKLAIPVFDDDLPLTAYPGSLATLLDAAREADAIILASPTYHGTISGAVKNVLDALNFLEGDDPPYFAGKPVGLMALGGSGAANVLTSLQHTARGLNGVVIPTVVMAGGSAIQDGCVQDEAVRRRVQLMVDELLDFAVRLRKPVLACAGAR